MCAVIRWPTSIRRSGGAERVVPRHAFVLGVCLLGSGCVWKYGLAGSGVPPAVKTIAVLPFENNTPEPGLQKNLLDGMRSAVGARLGLREASEQHADAVLKGTIQ